MKAEFLNGRWKMWSKNILPGPNDVLGNWWLEVGHFNCEGLLDAVFRSHQAF